MAPSLALFSHLMLGGIAGLPVPAASRADLGSLPPSHDLHHPPQQCMCALGGVLAETGTTAGVDLQQCPQLDMDVCV